MYTPSGHPAKDEHGIIVANPVEAILSAALMMDYSFGLIAERKLMEKSVEHVLRQGFQVGNVTSRSEDVPTDDQPQENRVLVAEKFGDEVSESASSSVCPYLARLQVV